MRRVQKAMMPVLLGRVCGERKERVGEAGDVAAKVFARITAAMVLPAKCGPGPLGNGGHWRCLSQKHLGLGKSLCLCSQCTANRPNAQYKNTCHGVFSSHCKIVIIKLRCYVHICVLHTLSL